MLILRYKASQHWIRKGGTINLYLIFNLTSSTIFRRWGRYEQGSWQPKYVPLKNSLLLIGKSSTHTTIWFRHLRFDLGILFINTRTEFQRVTHSGWFDDKNGNLTLTTMSGLLNIEGNILFISLQANMEPHSLQSEGFWPTAYLGCTSFFSKRIPKPIGLYWMAITIKSIKWWSFPRARSFSPFTRKEWNWNTPFFSLTRF